MSGNLKIEYLSDHPHFVDTLAAWLYEQWGQSNPGSSREKVTDLVRAHLNHEKIPLALVALVDSTAVGTACLRQHDLASCRDLAPWLGSVYVVPQYRRQGIGSLLVQRAEAEAHRLEIKALYLFTYDQERLYTKLGWKVLEVADNRGKPVTVMEKVLEAA